MSEHIIPPMTDVGPVTKIEQGENGYKATIGYTAQAIDEMVRRVNEKLDEEMMARLAEQHGYVKVVRCRDCKYSIHFFHHDDERWQCAEPHQEGDDVKPDAYCWRGERKEGGDDR